MKEWLSPHFEELEMNAEIGAYQPDPGDDRDLPPVLDPQRGAAAEREPPAHAD